MRAIISIICGALAINVIFAQEANQKAQGRKISNDTTMFATNRCSSKGGLGIVNTNLYIVANSAANELIVRPTEKTERHWRGQSAVKAEILVFYEGQVWPQENLPDRFDLSKSIVISFESDKVRFFDFHEMSGGYYERMKVSETK